MVGEGEEEEEVEGVGLNPLLRSLWKDSGLLSIFSRLKFPKCTIVFHSFESSHVIFRPSIENILPPFLSS